MLFIWLQSHIFASHGISIVPFLSEPAIATRSMAEYGKDVTIIDDFNYYGDGVLLQNEDNLPLNGTYVAGKVDTQSIVSGAFFCS